MSTPLCLYFGTCGGCTGQHIPYELQLENKKKHVEQALKVSNINVFSSKPYAYRNRMDFLFTNNGLGLRKKGNAFDLVDVEKCVISEEKINVLLKEVRDYFKNVDAFDQRKKRGTFRYAVIRISEKTSISFVLNAQSSDLQRADDLIRTFSQITTAGIVTVARVPADIEETFSDEFYVVKGEDSLQQTYLGKIFTYSTQGFFQNNHELAEKMHCYVRELLQTYPTSQGMLLDLYSGVGAFAIINADLFKEVIAIEDFPASVERARKNCLLNNVTNVQAICSDVKKLSKLSLRKPLYVITDPPRSGMDMQVISELNKLEPEIIIYVSCNLQQLAKDIPKFKNYTIKSAALFDLFPQTYHSETVAELVRK